jgi:hypothetical protein
MINHEISILYPLLERFVRWLNAYGETSYDHQSYFAGPIGGRAKALYYKYPLLGALAVLPMIFSEAFLPSARRLFWHPMRFPIADAHYAMGFAYLSQALHRDEYYHRASDFLENLISTRSPGYKHYGWGYPFDWVTRNGIYRANTPFITTLPYIYEAFSSVYQIDQNNKWLDVMRSIAEHAANDYQDFEIEPGVASCAYSPASDDKGGVINASAYRAALLMAASKQFADEAYKAQSERNVNFVLLMQQQNGSWLYASDSVRDFVDHFHTCFVLKALAKIEKLTGHAGCCQAIDKGIDYYVNNLFDNQGLPKPFSKAPRLTVYKNELYDYAECINLCVLLHGRYPKLDVTLERVCKDLIGRWQKPDGSFRSRKLYMGWDDVPMHRWAQSQIFRSLSFLLKQKVGLSQ